MHILNNWGDNLLPLVTLKHLPYCHFHMIMEFCILCYNKHSNHIRYFILKFTKQCWLPNAIKTRFSVKAANIKMTMFVLKITHYIIQ